MDFEIYCDHMYPNVPDTWSQVLQNFIEGEMLDAFDSIDGGRLPYYQVKEIKIIRERASTNKDKLMEKKYLKATRKKG